MERILADVYGPQNLLHQGGLPAELIYANPHFLRPCQGVVPVGGRYLTVYAVDLYRGIDGRFRVLRDWAGNPAGLGYALENPHRYFSRLFRALSSNPNPPSGAFFPHPAHQHGPARGRTRPGPGTRVAFSRSGQPDLLRTRPAFPLSWVSPGGGAGSDRAQRRGVSQKLAGLEPVDTIFRHISDESSDPFALRLNNGNGVAGLIQACREKHVDVVNPIGSGFVDTPVLPVFLPGLCAS